MGLQPVRRQNLSNLVMQQLVEFIQSGAVEPGEPLPSQTELAARLSVSRPVLREAMHGLALLGLLEIRPGSGCYIREPAPLSTETLLDAFSHESALEVLEVRMAIEVEIAALAAVRATDEDLEKMERALKQIEHASVRGISTVEATSEFHRVLALAAHNAVFFKLAQLLRQPVYAGSLRIEQALPSIMELEPDKHRVLLEAIRSRDQNCARVAMRDHLEIVHGLEEHVAMLRKLGAEHGAPPAVNRQYVPQRARS